MLGERKVDREIYTQADGQSGRGTNTQSDRLTQTNRYTERQAFRQN